MHFDMVEDNPNPRGMSPEQTTTPDPAPSELYITLENELSCVPTQHYPALDVQSDLLRHFKIKIMQDSPVWDECLSH